MTMVAERATWEELKARQVQRGGAGNGPGGRQLGHWEMIPLTAGESALLGELYAQYSGYMLGMIRKRLAMSGMSAAEVGALAEDLAQNAWMQVARRDRCTLLATPVDEEAARRFLAVVAKRTIGDHWAVRKSHERATDFTAPEWRALAAPEQQAAPELTDQCEELLSLLDPRARQAMVEYCYGVNPTGLASFLRCSHETAKRIVARAIRTMQGEVDEPKETGPDWSAVDPASPDALPETVREVLDALPEQTQAILLLRMAGIPYREIAERVGLTTTPVFNTVKRYAHLLVVQAVAA